MADKMVQITVEVLDVLTTVTKEMDRSQGSEFDLRLRFHDPDIISEKVLRRVIGRTDLEEEVG